MQVTYFKKGIRTMTEKRVVETGISPLASFFLSSAMRVGPGNILGVTGAIAVGGPGAVLDVDICVFRDGSCIHGGCPCSDFQGEEGR